MCKINHDLGQIHGIVFDMDGVLSPATVPLGSDGIPTRMANLRDGYAIQLAVKKGLKVAIISGGISEAVNSRFHMLGVKDIYMGVAHKMPVLRAWLDKNALEASEVAYVGDDIPDLEPMKSVGLPIAPGDAAIEAKLVAKYVTAAHGGYGVGREILEAILKSQRLWPVDGVEAYGK